MLESNRRRVLAGTCTAILAATLLFAAVDRLFGSSTTHPTNNQIAILGFFALLHAVLTVVAVFAITQLVRKKADRLGLAGAAFAIIGAVVSARIWVLIQLALLADAVPGAPRQSINALLQGAPIVWVSIIPVGLTYPIGLLALAAALFVARPVHRWVAVALAIGAILFPLGRAMDIGPALWASDAVLAIAYGYLSKEILNRRELWDDTLALSPEQRRDTTYEALTGTAR